MSHLIIAFLSEEGREKRQACEDEKLAEFYLTVPAEAVGVCLFLCSVKRTSNLLLNLSEEELNELIRETEHLGKGLKALKKKLAYNLDAASNYKLSLIKRFDLAISRGLEEFYQVLVSREIATKKVAKIIHWHLHQW